MTTLTKHVAYGAADVTALAPADHGADAPQRMIKSTHPASIMIVDDEPIIIKVVQKYLRTAGYEKFITTSDSREVFDVVYHQRPDVVVLDIMMPNVSGLDVLQSIRGDVRLRHIPVLILTAASDTETKIKALELGATDFLGKPVDSSELVARIRNMLIVKAHHDQLAGYSARLEEEVSQRTAELAQSRQEVIHVMACAAEYRDQETGNHVLRVGRYVGIIANQLGFDARRTELIEQAAILHDVGKIGVPDAVLRKPGKLCPEEFETMKCHCENGMKILLGRPCHARVDMNDNADHRGTTQSPVLRLAATIAISHHEKWDGSGYPLGLSGEMIPIEGRITAVADVFDALSSERPYKPAMPFDRCFEILENGRDAHFDSRVLDAFLDRADEIVKVALELDDSNTCIS